MNTGRLLALTIFVLTVVLIAIATIHPGAAALAYAGGSKDSVLGSVSTAEGAVEELGKQIKLQAWTAAYNSLANKAEFTEPEFLHDLTGYALSLRTYATLDSFEVEPLHETASDAEMRLKMHWSSVAGLFDDARVVKVVKNGDHWAVDWPLVHQQHVPPQVIPVNYLRWDVIRSGEGDDWGTQDVEAPHVRIVDMRPVNRADGVAVMGELLNEDVIPAFVSVRATLVGKNGATIDREGTFDMIQHTLLPKQVTPFIIHFPNVDLSQVASIRMEPLSVLVGASADPVVEIKDQQFVASPNPAVTGQLINESGQNVNVAHVLTTLYDKNGQVVWVAGQYIDRALLPQTPVDFRIPLPADLAKQGSTVRTVVATYSVGSGL